jgi:hypothetical protein
VRPRVKWMKGVAAFVLILLLVSCGTTSSTKSNNPYEKYYTGKEGVVTNFNNVPTKLYFYEPDGTSANDFTFGIEVRNQGASFTRGGVYLTGFDPNLFQFDEIPITRGGVGACGISLGNIGFGQLGGMLRCDGFEIAGDSGGIRSFHTDSLNSIIKPWWDPKRFDFQIDYDEGGNFIVNMNRLGKEDIEYYQHGRLFIAILSNINFHQNGGREFFLAGDTYEYPNGEYEYLTYHGHIRNWPVGLDQTTQHLLATTCYQYTTYADPIICVDPEPESEGRKVCTPKSKTWGGGNGAPVSITSVEQENTPRKLIFHINVKNIGGGKVWDAGKLEKCSPYYPGRATPDDLNVVYLGDVRIGNTGLRTASNAGGMSCSPQIIRLDPKTGTGTTTCTYPIEYTQIRSAYETPLVIELWYGYSQDIQKDVVIKRVT